jgi:hypothetical protein
LDHRNGLVALTLDGPAFLLVDDGDLDSVLVHLSGKGHLNY